jgi:hypothetical protein
MSRPCRTIADLQQQTGFTLEQLLKGARFREEYFTMVCLRRQGRVDDLVKEQAKIAHELEWQYELPHTEWRELIVDDLSEEEVCLEYSSAPRQSLSQQPSQRRHTLPKLPFLLIELKEAMLTMFE